MGTYLNPGNENFKEITSAQIYVDKTPMLSVLNNMLNTTDKYICMSRPRRFGKTIAGNMISSYYSKGCDSKDIFDKLKISSAPEYTEHLNRHNVIKIDVNSEYQNTMEKKDLIKKLTSSIRNEISREFSDIDFTENDSVANCIQKAYEAKGETFIIILDEYDVLVREKVPQELFDEFLGFLNGLFKSDTLRPAISLAYLTGILPVVRDRIQSKLNNFKEYTILDAERFAEYVGFTKEEVMALCDKYSISYDECRLWYDGYYQHGFEIYNPESVVRAIQSKKFSGYWGKTSTYRVISDLVEKNFSGIKDDVLKMISGENIYVDVGMYLNTMTDFATKDDVFTYLIHTGYLAYDNEEETCHIPNKEIRDEWSRALSVMSEYEITDRIIKQSRELLKSTISGDCEAVAKALDISHMHIASNRSYNNEDVLQGAIYLAYIFALNKYMVVKEMTAGKGFADVVYIPYKNDMPAMIIELKHNKTAESAIDQIKDKQYFDCLSDYSGDILFVGINYDENSKVHTCKIEKYVK